MCDFRSAVAKIRPVLAIQYGTGARDDVIDRHITTTCAGLISAALSVGVSAVKFGRSMERAPIAAPIFVIPKAWMKRLDAPGFWDGETWSSAAACYS